MFLGVLSAGIAAANVVRLPAGAAAIVVCSAAVSALALRTRVALACALALGGWAWGSARLEHLDHSVLMREVGTAERAVVVVTAQARRARFDLKLPVRVRRFGFLKLDEPAQLELPLRRAPPAGAVLEVRAEAKFPRGPRHGFDERTWLARRGVHVVLKGDWWRVVGARGGLGGVADRVHRWLGRSVSDGVGGERRAVVRGVVLGDEEGLSDQLRDDFRASGLYHLLAVSGQNVGLVAIAALAVAWLLGLPRWLGQIGALASISAYVLAVGLQPSVVRAGIAGALGCLAWLMARPTDKWYFLLLGALALLAWNPYVVFDAGFQLSFAAVWAIFTVVPRLQELLTGYPVPRPLIGPLAVSSACSLATAPVLWFQFHAIPLLAVPANAAAAPAVVPLLGLAFASAALHPLAPQLATAVARLNGFCAAYLTLCARLFAAVPFAQVRSGWAAAALAGGAAWAGAYAWRRGRAEARLSAHRRRSPEGDARGAPAA